MSKFKNELSRISHLRVSTVRVPKSGSKLAMPRCSVNFRQVCMNAATYIGPSMPRKCSGHTPAIVV